MFIHVTYVILLLPFIISCAVTYKELFLYARMVFGMRRAIPRPDDVPDSPPHPFVLPPGFLDAMPLHLRDPYYPQQPEPELQSEPEEDPEELEPESEPEEEPEIGRAHV